MGDLITLLNHLDLSALNTFLLVALYVVIHWGHDRIKKLEAYSIRHSTSIAVIKSRLDLTEDD